MRKLKVVQIGVTHEHANGKFMAVQALPDEYEVVGYVDERAYCDAVRFGDCSGLMKDIPRLTEEELWQRKNVDAVFVEVPNADLVPTALRVMEHNLPMHMDKPAGMDLGLYKKLLDGCEARGLAFQMGYMFRGGATFRYVKKLVEAGALGDIVSIDIDMDHCYGGDPYQEYLSKMRGGVMYNLGCHAIDYVVTLMGDKEPVRTVPFLQSAADVPGNTVSNAIAVIEYPHATATVRACSRKASADPISQRQARIGGTLGFCTWKPLERYDGKPITLNFYLKKRACGFEPGEYTIDFPPFSNYAQRFTTQLSEFAAMVRGEASSEYSFKHDYLVHKVALEAAGIV